MNKLTNDVETTYAYSRSATLFAVNQLNLPLQSRREDGSRVKHLAQYGDMPQSEARYSTSVMQSVLKY
jgi:hypothetical protein